METAGAKLRCRFCEREIAPWRWTAYLHAHKIPREKHDEIWPGKPYLDGWCPGGQHGTR